jgi:hypothetical protein
LKTKHADLPGGCDVEVRVREATRGRGVRAAGVSIRRLTVPDGRAATPDRAGLKLTRQPPPGSSEIATFVEQPWQMTDAGTWQLYCPAAVSLAPATIHKPVMIVGQVTRRPNIGLTRNIARH